MTRRTDLRSLRDMIGEARVFSAQEASQSVDLRAYDCEPLRVQIPETLLDVSLGSVPGRRANVTLTAT